MAEKRGQTDQKRDWEKFAQAVKNKRIKHHETKSDKSKDVGVNILNSKEMIVQPLETDTSGKAKKYERTGPQEFVKFVFEEVTIETIKKACNRHFAGRMPVGMFCDVLASDRGPSCAKMSHLPNFKPIHIRFIKGGSSSGMSSFDEDEYDKSRSMSNDYLRNIQSTSILPKFPASRSVKFPKSKSVVVPKSLPVSSMLRLGSPITAVKKCAEQIELSDFLISNMVWSPPLSINYYIDDEPFASGGFREAYMAKINPHDQKCKTYVVKKYLKGTITDLQDIDETPDAHARKSVQMHVLATNFALQLKQLLNSKQYTGNVLHYNKASLGKIVSTGETITVEDFVEGSFTKYINNDGSISGNINKTEADILQMAECLTHYSHFKSKGTILLVDIQGSGYTLYDPEIATTDGSFDEQNKLRFCMGNLAVVAKDNFFKQHTCNKFCELADLKYAEE